MASFAAIASILLPVLVIGRPLVSSSPDDGSKIDDAPIGLFAAEKPPPYALGVLWSSLLSRIYVTPLFFFSKALLAFTLLDRI